MERAAGEGGRSRDPGLVCQSRPSPEPGIKKSSTPRQGIEDCTRFAWSSISSAAGCALATGRAQVFRQVFWLLDHPTPGAFPESGSSGGCRFRPQLQRRDRDGLHRLPL